MPTILLDTDVVSFLIKGDTRATTYAPLVQGNTLAVSFMTVAELFQWAAFATGDPADSTILSRHSPRIWSSP
jgi:predicted nucleic acid-binding protein